MSPASGSEPVTLPTTVPLALFSAKAKGPPLTLGASLTSLRSTLIVLLLERPGVPSSLTSTWRAKLGVVSKSRAVVSLTRSAPEALSMAKAPPVLPPMRA